MKLIMVDIFINLLLFFNEEGEEILFDLKSNQIATHTFNTILDSFGEHRIKLEVIYDERVGDNTYLLGLDIPSDVKIGILAKDSKNYEFITNSLMAFKEKFQNLTIRYPSELISDQSIIATNDVNIIFGYNYIEENSLENPILDHLNSSGQTYIFPSLNQNITGKFDFFDKTLNTLYTTQGSNAYFGNSLAIFSKRWWTEAYGFLSMQHFHPFAMESRLVNTTNLLGVLSGFLVVSTGLAMILSSRQKPVHSKENNKKTWHIIAVYFALMSTLFLYTPATLLSGYTQAKSAQYLLP